MSLFTSRAANLRQPSNNWWKLLKRCRFKLAVPTTESAADEAITSLLSRVGAQRRWMHVEKLFAPHPVTGETINIEAPWPKDLTVAVKYLQRYSSTKPIEDDTPQ